MLGHSSTPNTVRSTDQDSNGDSLAFGSENDEKRGPAVRSRREPPPRLQTDSSGRLRLNEGASGRAGSGLGGFDSQASIMSTASDPTGRRAKPPFRRAGSSTHSLRSPRLGRKQSRSLGVLRALQASGMAERSYAPIHTGSSRRTLGTAAVVVPASSPTRQLLLQKHADRLEGLQKSFRSHSSSDSVRQKVSLRMQRKAQEYNYNFEVHGKRLQLSPRAWYMFGEDSRARQMAVWLTYHPRFDSVILALIILNSVVLAITDYSLDAIDSNMEPDADRSWRNAVPVYAQPVFTALFCLEFVLKALAMGFCFDAGSYLRDSWNVLDFLVVVTSVLNFIPGVPEITALRVFRVLRPLRTIELLPGLKLLVSALLKSLPQLATVVMFLTFIFSLFGVLGVQIWSGSLHSRCRLTEFPVQIPSTEVDAFFMRSTQYFDPVHADHAAAVTYIDRVLTDRSLYPWCGADVSGTPLPLDSDTWTFSSSPWQQSRDCVWPIDESDTKLCTQGSFGSHTCATDRWCGSNYDAYGNERFSSDRVMRSATFLPEFLFGYAGFDWIFPAFLTIFECITLESWADIMYMVQDSSGALVASLYFIILILFGSFLILNLTLAVIWGHLKAMQSDVETTKRHQEAVQRARQEHLRRLLRQARGGSNANSPSKSPNGPDGSPTQADAARNGPEASPPTGWATDVPATGLGNRLAAVITAARQAQMTGKPATTPAAATRPPMTVAAVSPHSASSSNQSPRSPRSPRSPLSMQAAFNLERQALEGQLPIDDERDASSEGRLGAIGGSSGSAGIDGELRGNLRSLTGSLVSLGKVATSPEPDDSLVAATPGTGHGSRGRGGDRAGAGKRSSSGSTGGVVDAPPSDDSPGGHPTLRVDVAQDTSSSLSSPVSEVNPLSEPDSPMASPTDVMHGGAVQNLMSATRRASRSTPVTGSRSSMTSGSRGTPNRAGIRAMPRSESQKPLVLGMGGASSGSHRDSPTTPDDSGSGDRAPAASTAGTTADAPAAAPKLNLGWLFKEPSPTSASGGGGTTVRKRAQPRVGAGLAKQRTTRHLQMGAAPRSTGLPPRGSRRANNMTLGGVSSQAKAGQSRAAEGVAEPVLSHPVVGPLTPPTKTKVAFLRRKTSSSSVAMSINGSFWNNDLKGARHFMRDCCRCCWRDSDDGGTRRKLSNHWKPEVKHASQRKGIAGCRHRLKRGVKHWAFNIFILVLITANTVVLALDQHPMDPQLAENLETINFVLTVLFFLEMVLKLVALGPAGYIGDRFNAFDGFIVTVSILELVLSPPAFIVSRTSPAESGGAVSALRTFRLFRVFSIARSWVSLRMLLRAIVQTLKDVANFAFLLLLFLYIFSIVGMQFFANRFHFDPETHLALTTSDPGYSTAHVPRTTFDNLLWSLVTVFQVLTAENWNQVMHDGIRSTGSLAVFYFVALVVLGNFIVLNLFLAILLGNFEGLEVMTIQEKAKARERRTQAEALKALSSSYRNLAGLVEGASGRESQVTTVTIQAASRGNRVSPATSPGHGSSNNDQLVPFNGGPTSLSGDYTHPATVPEEEDEDDDGDSHSDAASQVQPYDGEARRLAPDGQPRLDKGSSTLSSSLGLGAQLDIRVDTSPTRTTPAFGSQADASPAAPRPTLSEPAPASGLVAFARALRATPSDEAKPGDLRNHESDSSRDSHAKYELVGRSLCVFGPNSRIRRGCAYVVQSPWFDTTVLSLIIVSSILLAVDTPLLDPDSTLSTVLTILDIILTSLFTLEMLIKVVMMGFVVGKTSYMRNLWNVLDFVIVTVSILSLASSGAEELRSLRSLRTLRALRPLRVISRNPGLKLVVNALFRAIPSIINVLFVCVLFFLIFGIVGVSYFKGVFMSCQGRVFDDMTAEQQAFVTSPVPYADMTPAQQAWGSPPGYEGATSKAVCQWLGAEWGPSVPQRFDNIIDAAGTLFEMSTKEGWVDIMYAGVDATGVDMQPIRDNSPGWVVFFIAFMIIGNLFIMNLFVGVVIDNFNRMKEEMGENMFLTDAQREWVKTQETLLHVRPSKVHRPPMNNYFRQQVFYLVEKPAFEMFILTCILANTVIMAMLYFGQPDDYGDFLEFMNLTFAAIFMLEAGLKVLGLGVRQYFMDSWNVFDFTIVVGTLVGLVLKETGALDVGSVATIVRTFRMGRLIRIIQSAKSLRALFNTLVVTLPSLANVGGLLFLLYFIYAVLGVQSFAHVKFGDHLNSHANFRSFGTAIVTLVRASTGENWNLIMYDITSPDGACSSDPKWNDAEPNGCGVTSAYLYFFTFTLLVAFVMLNVFIAVILEGFGDMSDAENSVLSKAQLDDFAREWCVLDPTASMLIKTEHLPRLFLALQPPLGFNGVGVSLQVVNTFIQTLDLPTYSGNSVHFSDVLRGAGKKVMQEEISSRGATLEEIPSDHGVHAKWDRIKSKTKSIMSRYTAQQLLAADQIKDCFNVFLFRKSLAGLEDEADVANQQVSADDIRAQYTTEARQNLHRLNPELRALAATKREGLKRRSASVVMDRHSVAELLHKKAMEARKLTAQRSHGRKSKAWKHPRPSNAAATGFTVTSGDSQSSRSSATPGLAAGHASASIARMASGRGSTSPMSVPPRSPRMPMRLSDGAHRSKWSSAQSLAERGKPTNPTASVNAVFQATNGGTSLRSLSSRARM